MSDKFSSLLSKLRKQYPLLSDLIDNVDIIDRREQGMDGTGRKLEWQEAHDDRYDKHVMEIFDPALKGTELDQAVLGELLHSAHKYVPEYSQMREQLKSELSNSDVDNLIGIYEQSGDNRSFDKWFDISGLDAFIRGHAVGQWPDSKYTDGQKKLIDKMMGSLKGKTDMDNDLIHINEEESKVLEGAAIGTMENPIDGDFSSLSTEQIQSLVDVEQDWKSGLGPDSYPSGDGPPAVPLDTSLRPRLRPTKQFEDQEREEFYAEKDRMVNEASAAFPVTQGDPGYFKAYDHRQIRTHLPNSMAADGLSAGPLSVTGMHYVGADGEMTTGLRGEKTPAHLSKNQDTSESFLTSEMARSSIEQLRLSLPREVQDKLEGNVFVERADDGLFSLMVGDEDSGYVELSYGVDDYQDALSDVKRAFNYSAHSGDAKMDAGFMGRASSAYRYNGYSKSALTQIGKDRMEELQSDNDITPDKIADALFEVDAINDEISRLSYSSKATEISYSRRALNREAKQRAVKMMQ